MNKIAVILMSKHQGLCWRTDKEIVKRHVCSMASSKKVSSQAMLSASGLSFCTSQTCFFMLVGLVVNVIKEKRILIAPSLIVCPVGMSQQPWAVEGPAEQTRVLTAEGGWTSSTGLPWAISTYPELGQLV